jgi:hypothetical protein
MKRPRSILYIETPGVLLAMCGQSIVLRPREGAEIPISVGNIPRTIIAAGPGFAATSAAIKACIEGRIELLVTDDAATL